MRAKSLPRILRRFVLPVLVCLSGCGQSADQHRARHEAEVARAIHRLHEAQGDAKPEAIEIRERRQAEGR